MWQVESEFEEQWEDGKIIGWENKGLENGHTSSVEFALDLDYYSSMEELMEVGPEKLKEVCISFYLLVDLSHATFLLFFMDFAVLFFEATSLC